MRRYRIKKEWIKEDSRWLWSYEPQYKDGLLSTWRYLVFGEWPSTEARARQIIEEDHDFQKKTENPEIIPVRFDEPKPSKDDGGYYLVVGGIACVLALFAGFAVGRI